MEPETGMKQENAGTQPQNPNGKAKTGVSDALLILCPFMIFLNFMIFSWTPKAGYSLLIAIWLVLYWLHRATGGKAGWIGNLVFSLAAIAMPFFAGLFQWNMESLDAGLRMGMYAICLFMIVLDGFALAGKGRR